MKANFLCFLASVLVLGFAICLTVSCGDDDDNDNDDAADDDNMGDDDDDNDDNDQAGDDDNDNDATDDDTADDDTADDDADDDAADDDDGAVENPVQSECLTTGKDDDDYTFAESLIIDFADGALAVQHLNTCRNCEFGFEGTYTVEDYEIAVVEADVEPMVAFCDCPYNISYSIPGIEAAAYQFTLYKSDQKPGMDPTPMLLFEEALDLTQQTHFEFDLGEHECI